jgi:diguanylate cyclase (GGDEF)-like protein
MFLQELEAGYRKARDAHERLLKDANDKASLSDLHNFFHKIAGTAHAVDLGVLGYLSAVCEDLAKLVNKNEFAASAAAKIFSDGLAGVGNVLESHGSAATPRKPRSADQPAASSLSPSDHRTGEDRLLSKIIVIDDDPVSAKIIDNCLKDAGFTSSYCCDPEDAMRMINAELPDLIILDVMMPGVDGFDVCRRVRSNPALQFTPIIFVTRKGDLEQRVRGLEVGGNDYISKPFEPPELIARVRSHLQRLDALREMAIRDGLTHCYNHKYFKMRLEQEIARAQRYKVDLAMALIDVDHFKKINDTHGHPVGDGVLAHLAGMLNASVRSTDVVARYGGEEFGILFMQAGANEAAIVTNRIRERVAGHKFAITTPQGLLQVPVTISIGVSQLCATDTLQRLLQSCDSALYEAKSGGRNQVQIAKPR